MLVCSQCHHQNPDHLHQCEACCAELDLTSACPNCGSPSLPDTKFCGQCGMSLQTPHLQAHPTPSRVRLSGLPELSPPEPVIDLHLSWFSEHQPTTNGSQDVLPRKPALPAVPQPKVITPESSAKVENISSTKVDSKSVLRGVLVHRDTQFKVHLEAQASPIRLGKPNPQVMPDINLASFPHAEVVSRIHADILCDNRNFFIQDNGSANGTFINSQRIKPGNPHPLAPGDRISFGKGDLVTFTFELF